jgi:hypothetical protein
MESDDLLCSRNARLKKALVGRAQWKINQSPFLKRKQASFDGSSAPSLDGRGGTYKGGLTQRSIVDKRKKKRAQWRTKPGRYFERENEQAWNDC